MIFVLWIAALAWGWMLAFRGLFWRIDPIPAASEPARWPEVVAVIPARNEADCIADTVTSLLSSVTTTDSAPG